MRKTLLAAAAALPFACAPMVLAQSPAYTSPAPSGPGAPMPGAASPAPPGAAAPAPTRLGEPQVINALEAQGFTEVRTVKRSGYILQMQAKKDGKPVMLVVNTVTGQAREYPQR